MRTRRRHPPEPRPTRPRPQPAIPVLLLCFPKQSTVSPSLSDFRLCYHPGPVPATCFPHPCGIRTHGGSVVLIHRHTAERKRFTTEARRHREEITREENVAAFSFGSTRAKNPATVSWSHTMRKRRNNRQLLPLEFFLQETVAIIFGWRTRRPKIIATFDFHLCVSAPPW